MRFKGTYLLAVLFLLVLGYVYIYEIKGESERRAAEENAKKVFVFDKDEVSRIHLKNYSDTMVIKHGANGWEFESPIATDGDESQIDIILTSLENAEIERVVEDSVVDFKPFGLEKPQVILQIETDESAFDTLYMGNHNPTGSFVYSRLSGQDRVILVPASVYNNANKKFFALRDKSVLKFDREDVQRMILTREKGNLRFGKEEGKWWVEEPISARGDHGKIERIINNLSNLKAKEIPSEGGEDLSKFGLAEPWGRVDLFLGENLEMKSLLLGKAKENGDVYVKDASRKPVFLIPPAVVKQVNDDLDGYRSRKALDFDRQGVVGIGLIYPDKTIRCEKDTSGDWFYYTEESPIRRAANAGRMSRLLSDLNGLRIEDFVGEVGKNLDPYGLEQPRAKIEVTQEGSESAVLAIGKKSVEETGGKKKEYAYVMNDEDGWIYTVKAAAADKMFLGVEDIKEATGEGSEGEGIE